MTKTIEINGATLFKIAAILIGTSLLIYFLNKYDRDQKSVLLMDNIELLQNSKSYADINALLQNQDTSIHEDQLSQVAGVTDNLNRKVNGSDPYYYGGLRVSSLTFFTNGTYYKYSSRHSGYSNQLKGFKEVVLPEETEEVIDKIRENKADLHQILKASNKGKRKKNIILPITSDKGEWYLEFYYYDKS